MARSGTRRIWYLALVGVVALVLTIGLVSLQPHDSPFKLAVRGVALLGYLAIFLAVLSSAYMRQAVRIFGRPFTRVHHVLSVAGLLLVTVHPLGVVIAAVGLSVFLPRFDSLIVFLELGGRLAWYLVACAALAAVLRRAIGRVWRAIHTLNYVAFLLATVHGMMIGTDLQYTIVKALAAILALLVVAMFVQKRLPKRQRSSLA